MLNFVKLIFRKALKMLITVSVQFSVQAWDFEEGYFVAGTPRHFLKGHPNFRGT